MPRVGLGGYGARGGGRGALMKRSRCAAAPASNGMAAGGRGGATAMPPMRGGPMQMPVMKGARALDMNAFDHGAM